MPLRSIVNAGRLTEIVDIGANPIDGDPPYKPMLDFGMCKIIGFEPQEKALEELLQKKNPQDTYLPHVIGDGKAHTLHICHASGMSSLLTPNEGLYDVFPAFKEWGKVVSTLPVQSIRLDDIDAIVNMDFLKIDVQGSELDVFTNGKTKLQKTVFIQTEISFLPLYKNQPLFADIDLELRAQGFIPHHFAAINRRCIAPLVLNNNSYDALNQLFEADMVYVRNFIDDKNLDNEQLKQMALIAHHCYGSFDLTLRCILLLEQRGDIGTGSQLKYFQLLGKMQQK